jgi:hypothetical protein
MLAVEWQPGWPVHVSPTGSAERSANFIAILQQDSEQA